MVPLPQSKDPATRHTPHQTTKKRPFSLKGEWSRNSSNVEQASIGQQAQHQTPKRSKSTQTSQTNILKEGDPGFPLPSGKGCSKKDPVTKASFVQAYPEC